MFHDDLMTVTPATTEVHLLPDKAVPQATILSYPGSVQGLSEKLLLQSQKVGPPAAVPDRSPIIAQQHDLASGHIRFGDARHPTRHGRSGVHQRPGTAAPLASASRGPRTFDDRGRPPGSWIIASVRCCPAPMHAATARLRIAQRNRRRPAPGLLPAGISRYHLASCTIRLTRSRPAIA
jgi:hypothetical protein